MAVSIFSTLPTLATVGVSEQFQVCTTTDGHAGEIVTVLITLANPEQAPSSCCTICHLSDRQGKSRLMPKDKQHLAHQPVSR